MRGPSVILTAIACFVISACQQDPYATLTESELAYVIPNSASLGRGNPCDDADCGGAVEIQTLPDALWLVVKDFEVLGESEGGKTTTAQLTARTSSRGTSTGQFIVIGWHQDVDAATRALEDGFEVWAAMECPGVQPDYVCHFVAFDQQGRLAGLGYGQGVTLTVPLAQSAAATGAVSGRSFLEDLVFGSDRTSDGELVSNH